MKQNFVEQRDKIFIFFLYVICERFLTHPPLLTYVRREQSNRTIKKTVQEC